MSSRSFHAFIFSFENSSENSCILVLPKVATRPPLHTEYDSPSLLCWQRATNLRESVSICIKQLHNTRKINENTNSGIKLVIQQLVKRNPLVRQLVQLFDNGIIRLHFCFREGFKLLIGV